MSQTWRLWTHATIIPHPTTFLINHLPPFSDHLPLPLIWYQSPIFLIPVTPFSHSHYSGDQLLLPPIWWPLSTSTSWVSTSHSDHSSNKLLLPPHQWLPPTLTNPLTTSQSHHCGDLLQLYPSTPPPIGTVHTPSYTLLSYSTPNYSLPNMFLPTPSTSSSPSSTSYLYQ